MATEEIEEYEFKESIKNARKALALCLCNKFTEAQKFLQTLDGSCMYHSLSISTIAYLQAVLTYEQKYIQLAHEKVKETLKICDKQRKKRSWNESIYSWFGKPYFDDFSIIELHAELCYAECLLEEALLTFLQDENLISFVKGGLKIRNAYQLYRCCLIALEQNPFSLKGSSTRADFESGVEMGMGTFNLLLSLLPPRVLKLLEWVGFSGDKEQGLFLLDKGCNSKGLRDAMCGITLLGFHLVVSPLLGIGDSDISYSSKHLSRYMETYPNSSLFLYFSGRLLQTQCQIKEALIEYEKSVSVNIDWKQIHHICYWEMMWCYSFKGDWSNAAMYASILADESKWSKSSYKYMHAAFLIMQQPECNKDLNQSKLFKEKIEKLLDEVVQHKQRIAGKSIPFEKFAVTRVHKYRETGRLILPGLEIIHIWNGFTMFHKHENTLREFLLLTEKSLNGLQEETGLSKHHHDNVCLCKLLQGICLHHLKKNEQAEKVLTEVANSPFTSHSSKMDSYYPPFAAAELAFMFKNSGELEKALEYFNYALENYSNYGLENRLHFRLHSAIANLKKLNE
ncbi:tetratricopeptide repeat protein 39B isoform X1 [Hydra vulgaris]|nr:tetratricopeptide repeat protein 39B [Hydra vulgaris]